jgi:hypothetical protein
MNNVNFIQTYFTEERIESLIFIIIGSIAITLTLIFLSIIKYSFFKGLAYPLLFIGIIQIVVGFNIYNRSQKDIIRVEQIVKTSKKQLQTTEIPRMKTVIKNFAIYKWTEIILMLTGIFLITRFYKSPLTFWKGLGLGLLIQAGIMLCLDIIAEHRAEIYLQYLLKA